MTWRSFKIGHVIVPNRCKSLLRNPTNKTAQHARFGYCFFFFLLYLITCGISPLKEISLEGIFRSVVYKAQERICIHDRSRRKKEHVGLEHMHFHESISVARVSQKAKKGYVATHPLFHSILHACFTRSTSNIRFTIIKCSLA